ncbi:membrane spanning protein [Cutibacterium acnes JCM 18920]|nr:membrane spanning protein [Cutibacterium acnes JCM 18920]
MIIILASPHRPVRAAVNKLKTQSTPTANLMTMPTATKLHDYVQRPTRPFT